MTEPHWPADGSGDEFDGGYDPTAYRGGVNIDVEWLSRAVEMLPRWPVHSEEGEPPENTRYGRLISLDDVLQLFAAAPSEETA
jgi:hypothetical protein